MARALSFALCGMLCTWARAATGWGQASPGSAQASRWVGQPPGHVPPTYAVEGRTDSVSTTYVDQQDQQASRDGYDYGSFAAADQHPRSLYSADHAKRSQGGELRDDSRHFYRYQQRWTGNEYQPIDEHSMWAGQHHGWSPRQQHLQEQRQQVHSIWNTDARQHNNYDGGEPLRLGTKWRSLVSRVKEAVRPGHAADYGAGESYMNDDERWGGVHPASPTWARADSDPLSGYDTSSLPPDDHYGESPFHANNGPYEGHANGFGDTKPPTYRGPSDSFNSYETSVHARARGHVEPCHINDGAFPVQEEELDRHEPSQVRRDGSPPPDMQDVQENRSVEHKEPRIPSSGWFAPPSESLSPSDGTSSVFRSTVGYDPVSEAAAGENNYASTDQHVSQSTLGQGWAALPFEQRSATADAALAGVADMDIRDVDGDDRRRSSDPSPDTPRDMMASQNAVVPPHVTMRSLGAERAGEAEEHVNAFSHERPRGVEASLDKNALESSQANKVKEDISEPCVVKDDISEAGYSTFPQHSEKSSSKTAETTSAPALHHRFDADNVESNGSDQALHSTSSLDRRATVVTDDPVDRGLEMIDWSEAEDREAANHGDAETYTRRSSFVKDEREEDVLIRELEAMDESSGDLLGFANPEIDDAMEQAMEHTLDFLFDGSKRNPSGREDTSMVGVTDACSESEEAQSKTRESLNGATSEAAVDNRLDLSAEKDRPPAGTNGFHVGVTDELDQAVQGVTFREEDSNRSQVRDATATALGEKEEVRSQDSLWGKTSRWEHFPAPAIEEHVSEEAGAQEAGQQEGLDEEEELDEEDSDIRLAIDGDKQHANSDHSVVTSGKSELTLDPISLPPSAATDEIWNDRHLQDQLDAYWEQSRGRSGNGGRSDSGPRVFDRGIQQLATYGHVKASYGPGDWVGGGRRGEAALLQESLPGGVGQGVARNSLITPNRVPGQHQPASGYQAPINIYGNVHLHMSGNRDVSRQSSDLSARERYYSQGETSWTGHDP